MAAKAKKSLTFNPETQHSFSDFENVIEAARRAGRRIRGLGPNNDSENKSAAAAATPAPEELSENEVNIGSVARSHGPYSRAMRKHMAEMATAHGGPISSEDLRLVGFQKSRDNDDEIEAKVCSARTGVCFLVGVSSIVAGFLLGRMGQGGGSPRGRKTRRARKPHRKQTRRRKH